MGLLNAVKRRYKALNFKGQALPCDRVVSPYMTLLVAWTLHYEHRTVMSKHTHQYQLSLIKQASNVL
jgi:hypothetical protein